MVKLPCAPGRVEGKGEIIAVFVSACAADSSVSSGPNTIPHDTALEFGSLAGNWLPFRSAAEIEVSLRRSASGQASDQIGHTLLSSICSCPPPPQPKAHLLSEALKTS